MPTDEVRPIKIEPLKIQVVQGFVLPSRMVGLAQITEAPAPRPE
jgi:hypothetical protein